MAATARTRVSNIFGKLTGGHNLVQSSAEAPGVRLQHFSPVPPLAPLRALPTPPLTPLSPSLPYATPPRSPLPPRETPSTPRLRPVDEVPEPTSVIEAIKAVSVEDKPPGEIAAKRIEDLAVQTGHQLRELKLTRKLLLSDVQKEAAHLEACVKAWRETLTTSSGKRVESDVLTAEVEASFARLGFIVEWILARPDALGPRDRYGRRPQLAFAKIFKHERSKLASNEEYLQETLGDSGSFVSLTVAKARARSLVTRIDTLVRTIDDGTESTVYAIDRIDAIDHEIEELKPYGANNKGYNGAPRLTALAVIVMRRKSKAKSEEFLAAEGLREDAYVAFRAIRRTLEGQCLDELKGHKLAEKTSFATGHVDMLPPAGELPIFKRYSLSAQSPIQRITLSAAQLAPALFSSA